jgi:protein SDA1
LNLLRNLPALQNLIKRDPDAYAAEFATQWDHYQSLRSVIQVGLSVGGGGDLIGAGSTTQTGGSGNNKGRKETEDKFKEVIGFLAHVCPQTSLSHYSKSLLSSCQNLLLLIIIDCSLLCYQAKPNQIRQISAFRIIISIA